MGNVSATGSNDTTGPQGRPTRRRICNCVSGYGLPAVAKGGDILTENLTEKNLTPRQRKAIEALLTSGTVEAASKAAGVSRESLYRWLKDASFVSELRATEALAVESLARSLAGLGDLAASALRDALSDAKITVRLRSAEIVTDRLLKLRELVSIEQRLAELEAKANAESKN